MTSARFRRFTRQCSASFCSTSAATQTRRQGLAFGSLGWGGVGPPTTAKVATTASVGTTATGSARRGELAPPPSLKAAFSVGAVGALLIFVGAVGGDTLSGAAAPGLVPL